MLLEDFDSLFSSQIIYKSIKWNLLSEFDQHVVSENKIALRFAELFVHLEAIIFFKSTSTRSNLFAIQFEPALYSFYVFKLY